MDTLLQGGDHAVDRRGLPQSVDGLEEMIQRAMLRLGIRRGSFRWDPELGSELHLLSRDTSATTRRAAWSMVQEALLPLPGISVGEVGISKPSPDVMKLSVVLSYKGSNALIELSQDAY